MSIHYARSSTDSLHRTANIYAIGIDYKVKFSVAMMARAGTCILYYVIFMNRLSYLTII